MACKKLLRLKASAVLNSLRNFNLARKKRLLKGAFNLASEKRLLKGAFNLTSEKRLLKDACRIEVKKCDPRRGGGYSDIFEQHRLSLFFGVQIQINIFGSGDLGITCKYLRVG